MVILGLILLIIGFVAKIAILWTIGIIVLVVGLILALLGSVGHAVGGEPGLACRPGQPRVPASAGHLVEDLGLDPG